MFKPLVGGTRPSKSTKLFFPGDSSPRMFPIYVALMSSIIDIKTSSGAVPNKVKVWKDAIIEDFDVSYVDQKSTMGSVIESMYVVANDFLLEQEKYTYKILED